MELNEKKSSVSISEKDWHFRLINYVLGDFAPTSRDMHNLCPYFWLLVFSLITVPFVGAFKISKKIFFKIGDFLEKTILGPLDAKIALSFQNKINDDDVYNYYKKCIIKNYRNRWDNIIGSESDILIKYLKEKHNIIVNANDLYYGVNNKDYINLIKEIKAKHLQKENDIYERKEKRSKQISDIVDNTTDKLENVVTKVKSWKTIILWTKRFIGLLITTVGLVITYFILNYVSLGLTYIVTNISLDQLIIIVSIVGIVASVIALAIGISKLAKFLQYHGRNLLIIDLLAKFFQYTIILPGKIIFVSFLWNFLLKNVAAFIAIIGITIWKGILGSLGIFGEYAGHSYTDYCPGIEWEDEENNSEEK